MTQLYKFKRRFLAISFILTFLSTTGCKKFIEVDPPSTSVTEESVFLEDATAAAALTSIYAQMSNSGLSLNLNIYPELSADNLSLYTNVHTDFTVYSTNSLSPTDDGTVPNFWTSIYQYIYQTNAAIEGLSKSTTLSPTVKRNLLGEAYFLRAFFYYYLVELYGDVSLALTTSYATNNKLVRTSASEVLAQAINDLKQGQSLLTDDYLQSNASTPYPNTSQERVRPNKSACSALMARIYLTQKDWSNAETAADEVISKYTQYAVEPLDRIFLKNSQETIWELQPVGDFANTPEGDFYILPDGAPSDSHDQTVYLSDKFVTSFLLGDQRKVKWIGSVEKDGRPYYYAYKYKVDGGTPDFTEYTVVLRLAEVYLIRAEARIQQNKIPQGVADLNVLRYRAIDNNEPDESKRLHLLPTSLSKESALDALYYESRVEMFCEWGHRWFDLKRTSQLATVMPTAAQEKGGSWADYKALYPVPANEIRLNTSLSQNNGYK